ncbi:MAG: hypothetical protein ACP5NP_04630 [Acetobacteraceae bacterium]
MTQFAFPTLAVVPPLLVSFGVLAFLHWRGKMGNQILDLRFVLMVGAIILMFAQILAAGTWPVVSWVCFPLAMLWLLVSLFLLRRQWHQ